MFATARVINLCDMGGSAVLSMLIVRVPLLNISLAHAALSICLGVCHPIGRFCAGATGRLEHLLRLRVAHRSSHGRTPCARSCFM